MPITVTGGMTSTNGPLQGRLGRQQQESFVAKARAYQEAAEATEAKRLSAVELRQRQALVRDRLVQMFGPWPSTVALNSVVAGTFSRSGYTVERVRFQSFTNFWVTANLYLPTGASSSNKVPGVVELCGHDAVGKANASYQSAAIGLARAGFACLVVDAVGMGERKMIPSTPTEEHRTIGQTMPLVGWNLAGLQTWDAMRAVDYLFSRAEINTNHIGAFGQSGGGTQAIWLLANDSRVTMGAVSCSHSTLRAIMEDELWADHEQTPPNILKLGLDFDDILSSFAPKPLLVIGQDLDYFDKRGVLATYRSTQNVYTRLSAKNEIRIYFGTGSHGLPTASREQMYQWFTRAVTGVDSPITEAAITPETEATLLVTVSGNVSEIANSINSSQLQTVFADAAVAARGTYNVAELQNRVKATLKVDWPQTSAPHYRSWAGYSSWVNSGLTLEQVYAAKLESTGVDGALVAGEKADIALTNAVGDRLSVREKTAAGTAADHFSVVRVSNSLVKVQAHNANGSLQAGNTSTVTVHNFGQPSAAVSAPNYPKTGSQVYAVETEPGILIPLYHVANTTFEGFPLQEVAPGTRCLLYIPHSSADQELSQPGRTALMNTIVAGEPTAQLFAMDLRGYGELKPHLNLSAYAENFHAQAADMLGEPMLGKMVTDILRCIDLLAAHGYTVHLAGLGFGSIPAALAGLLHSSVKQVTLVNSLTRWYACAKALPHQMAWPQSLLPRGVLARFDLIDVYASLPSLSNTSQWGAWGGLGGET